MEDNLLIKDCTSDEVINQVCRTCLNPTASYCTLEAQETNILMTCIPQINIELTQDPVICQTCMEQLLGYHTFLNSCLQSEEQLINYCKNYNIVPPITSTDLLKMQINSTVIKVEDCLLDVVEDETKLNEEIPILSNKTDQSIEEKITPSFKCEFCIKRYKSKKALDRHKKANNCNQTLIKCETCEMTFTSKYDYKKHIMIHAANAPISKPFGCSICNKFFNRKSRLQRHKETHIRKAKPFRCRECGKKFTNEALLGIHMEKIHLSEKNFQCTICSHKYSTKQTLDRHVKTHQEVQKEKKIPTIMCDFCGQLFFRKSALERHVMSHTGLRPFSCTECSKTFKEYHILKIHMRHHTGEKPFSCNLCDYKSSNKSRLSIHMRKHTGERPYPCPHCDKKFTRNSHSILHVRAMHTGERPFSCDICGKTFTRRDYLMKHKKIHVKK